MSISEAEQDAIKNDRVIAFIDNRYFVGVCFVNLGDGLDYLGGMFRDLPNGEWKLVYRFRYPDGQRRWWCVTGSSGSEAAKERLLTAWRLTVRGVLESLGHGQVDWVKLESADPEHNSRTLLERPWNRVVEIDGKPIAGDA